MHPRAMPPRWRSPSPNGRADTQAGRIQSHKNQISRHRKRAPTPPDYWSIGFPSTQQVASINERAAVMHAEQDKRMALQGRMYLCFLFLSSTVLTSLHLKISELLKKDIGGFRKRQKKNKNGTNPPARAPDWCDC